MHDIKEFLESGTIISVDRDRVMIGYGKRNWNAHAKKNATSFYFPDYFLTESKPWCTQEHTIELKIDQLLEMVTPSSHNPSPITWQNPFKETFENAFVDLQRRFAKKELKKAVPYVVEKTTTQMTESILRRALLNILKSAQNYPLHVYGFWENGQGMLGATPELLFSIEKKERSILQTVACAGTKSARHGSLDSLLNDSKERDEHAIVVEGISEALSPFGNVQRSQTGFTSVPGLSHLMTPISVELNGDYPFDQFVAALHPTPALGAFPKEEGWKWLSHYQTFVQRYRYGAPAGLVDPRTDVTRCLVAIRNVQWTHDGMMVAAGCGVVKESKLEHEWQEIQTKLRAIKQMLNIEV